MSWFNFCEHFKRKKEKQKKNKKNKKTNKKTNKQTNKKNKNKTKIPEIYLPSTLAPNHPTHIDQPPPTISNHAKESTKKENFFLLFFVFLGVFE